MKCKSDSPDVEIVHLKCFVFCLASGNGSFNGGQYIVLLVLLAGLFYYYCYFPLILNSIGMSYLCRYYYLMRKPL